MTGTAEQRETAAVTGSRRRGWLWLFVRIAVTVAALAWTVTRVSVADMLDAADRLSPVAGLGAFSVMAFALWVGALRWRTLLMVFGATGRPSLFFLTRVYLVGLFYNTFIPGNVGGDLLRGHVTRAAFDGAGGGYLVVLIERIFGLAGLLTLGASILLLHPIGDFGALPILAVAGLVGALAAAAAPLVARRLAQRLPLSGTLGRIRIVCSSLPTVERPALLAVVLLLSVGTQALTAVSGHLLVSSIDSEVLLIDSLVLVPLALIAQYFPATVAGLGVREAAFVYLFTVVGVDRADATAASLAYLAVQLLLALLGGLVHLLWPLRAPSNEAAPTVAKPQGDAPLPQSAIDPDRD